MKNRSWMVYSTVALLALLTLGPVGCVSQRQYDDQVKLYRRSQEQVAQLQAQIEELNARIKALTEAARPGDADLADKLAKALADRDAMAKKLQDALDKLAQGSGTYGPLPSDLDQALRDLAASDPNLMEYDSKLGMVRFKSDLTFALGSTEVTAEGKRALQKLADILARPVAQGYEARIVGHTDNVRIARAETRAKHPTNWHLSVHRSIAVKDVLAGAGVPEVRIGVAGYGQNRPVVPNGPRGAAQNRRVEIFLVPNNYTGPGTAGEGAAAAAPVEVAPAPAPAPVPAEVDDPAFK